MKKLVCIVLALVVSLLCAACGNGTNTTGNAGENNSTNGGSGNAVANRDYFEWSATDKTIIIGCTEEGLKQTELVIPADCTRIGNMQENTTVQKIRFENQDTTIARDAFLGCTALVSVELPAHLALIDNGTFYGCTSLKSVVVPENVTKIGSTAFWGCTSLEQVTLNGKLEEVGRKAFYGCAALKTIVLPDSVTSIGEQAFEGCDALETVTFGNGLRTVGESAFERCVALKEVKLPEGVTTLEENAFSFCDSLEAIYLPASLENMDIACIMQTHNLKVYVVEGSYADLNFDSLRGVEFFEKQYQ